jgi:serine/threonine-protein kinase
MLPQRVEARRRVRIGRYLVVGRMGRGGMGMVYRARDEALEREVALKTLNAEGSLDADSRRRFEIEAKAAARLAHPNIVTVYELGEERGVPYIAMEMLSGVDLEALLRKGPPLATAEKLDVLVQVCRGLAFAHERGIVHRDVKPSNVRLLEDGTAKIMDFGIAKLGGTHLTKTGMMVGTVNYMSPEQVRGRPLDGRSDVFSAGVILYEMLAGERPFRGEGPTQTLYRIVNEEPAPLDTAALGPAGERLGPIVSRALAKEPSARHQGAAALADELQAVLDDLQRTAGTDARAGVRSAVAARGAAAPPATVVDDGFPELEATFAHPQPHGEATEVATTVVQGTSIDGPTVGIPSTVGGAPTVGAASPAAVPATVRPPEPTASRSWLWAGIGLLAVVAAAAFVLVRGSRPAAPVELRIPVRSLPVGAAVLVDGRDSGVVTNGELVLPARPPGDVQLTFRKPGHRDETRTVRVPAAAGEAVSVTLAAATPLVRVTTQPPGASVTLDGERVAGTTPLDLAVPGAGDHRIAVALDGHAPREVTLAAGERPASLDLALDRLAPPGAVVVRSSYPVDVSWRGRSLARGEASPRVPVPGGRQVLMLSAPAVFLRAEVVVEVPPRGEAAVQAPGLGRLNVRATPDNCQIFVDGAFVDYPPILDRPAAAGRHVIGFRWPDGSKREEAVEVKAGSPAFVVGRKE